MGSPMTHELLKYPFLVPQVSEIDLYVALAHMQICVLLSFYKGTSCTGLGPILMTSFNVNYLLKGLLCKYLHSEAVGARTSACEFGGTHFSP